MQIGREYRTYVGAVPKENNPKPPYDETHSIPRRSCSCGFPVGGHSLQDTSTLAHICLLVFLDICSSPK